MNKVLRMPLNFSMRQMKELELVYGLETVSFTTTPLGGLITVLVARYCVLSTLVLKVFPYVQMISISWISWSFFVK